MSRDEKGAITESKRCDRGVVIVNKTHICLYLSVPRRTKQSTKQKAFAFKAKRNRQKS